MLRWLSPGEGEMPIHDEVGINCEKGANIENHCSDVKYVYGLRGVC